MPDEPLPRATPTKGPRPQIDPPAVVPFVDRKLSQAIGYRLLHRHEHTAEGATVAVCTLGKNIEAGDGPGKSMMVLNGYLAKGYEPVHTWEKAIGETSIMVLIFANV